jgi:hypothetical protein
MKGLGGLLAVTAGCAAPNLYTTPRSIPAGEHVGFVAPQLVQRPDEVDAAGNEVSFHYAALFGGRVGLWKRVDVGARTNLGSAAFDVKWNAIRGERFDLALDLGVQFLPTTRYLDLPVLLGINVSDSISILPSTGLTLGQGHEPDLQHGATYIDSSEEEPPAAGRLFLRAGLALQLRFTPRFAVQPELTYLALSERGTPTHDFLTAGLGFCFGAQPY